MLRANPPPPFSMLYKKEANSRGRKFNIEKGGGGSIVEIRKEICLKYSKMTKCLNTFVAHCSSQKGMIWQNKKNFDFSSLIFDSRNSLAASLNEC